MSQSDIELQARSSKSSKNHGQSSRSSRLEEVVVHSNDIVDGTFASEHDATEVDDPKPKVGVDESPHSHSLRAVADADVIDTLPTMSASAPSSPEADADTEPASPRVDSAAVAPDATATSNNEEGAHGLRDASGATASSNTQSKRQPKKPFFGLRQNAGNYGAFPLTNAFMPVIGAHIACICQGLPMMITRRSMRQIHGVRKLVLMPVSGEFILTRRKLTTTKWLSSGRTPSICYLSS